MLTKGNYKNTKKVNNKCKRFNKKCKKFNKKSKKFNKKFKKFNKKSKKFRGNLRIIGGTIAMPGTSTFKKNNNKFISNHSSDYRTLHNLIQQLTSNNDLECKLIGYGTKTSSTNINALNTRNTPDTTNNPSRIFVYFVVKSFTPHYNILCYYDEDGKLKGIMVVNLYKSNLNYKKILWSGIHKSAKKIEKERAIMFEYLELKNSPSSPFLKGITNLESLKDKMTVKKATPVTLKLPPDLPHEKIKVAPTLVPAVTLNKSEFVSNHHGDDEDDADVLLISAADDDALADTK